MNKAEYSILLKTKEWQKKRLAILKRDSYKCTKCGSIEKLHVHHKKYVPGKKPWEIQNKHLATLCNVCHNDVHSGKPITDFIIRTQTKASKSQRIANKIQNLRLNLSKKDSEIQKLYDNRNSR